MAGMKGFRGTSATSSEVGIQRFPFVPHVAPRHPRGAGVGRTALFRRPMVNLRPNLAARLSVQARSLPVTIAASPLHLRTHALAPLQPADAEGSAWCNLPAGEMRCDDTPHHHFDANPGCAPSPSHPFSCHGSRARRTGAPRQFYGSLSSLPTRPGGRRGTPPTMPVCGGGGLKPSATYHNLEADGSNPLPCSSLSPDKHSLIVWPRAKAQVWPRSSGQP
jgi:hypothetical protein